MYFSRRQTIDLQGPEIYAITLVRDICCVGTGPGFAAARGTVATIITSAVLPAVFTQNNN